MCIDKVTNINNQFKPDFIWWGETTQCSNISRPNSVPQLEINIENIEMLTQ